MVEGKRAMSTLSTQALWMMNSPFVRENSVALADRLLEGGSEQAPTKLVVEAYQCVLGRPPSQREREIGVGYLSASPEDTAARLNQFIQTLYASIEFRYVH